jgi:molecular chaperone DnaK
MGRAKIDYGIDLGTTNSALSRMENGEVVTFEIDASRIVPSCVSYDRRGRVRVGSQARRQIPFFKEFKRKMGSDWTAELPDGSVKGAEDLSSELLRKLASEITDESFKAVVITVPAAFTLPQVSATKRAGELAGFDQVEILMEPVAAAFNYAYRNKIKNGKFVVFDFGGGTFDAALVDSSEGVMEVRSSEGDNWLGGGDIDKAIVDEILLPYVREEYEISDLETKDEKDHKYWRSKLKNIADDVKIELGKYEEYEYLSVIGDFPEDDSGKEIEIDTTFTREQLNKVATPFFQRAIDCTKRLLEQNALSVDDLKALVMVGGPTQIPYFRKMVEEQLIKPDISVNPMTGISEGAALYASTMENRIPSHGNRTDESDAKEAAVELSVGFRSHSNMAKEPISIVCKEQGEFRAEIIEERGNRTALASLDAVFEVDIDQKRPNNFSIKLYNDKNELVRCAPSEFTISPGIVVDGTSGASTLPKHIGMDFLAADNKIRFHAFRGLEKDKPMPATGMSTRELFTTSDLRPGIAEDEINISLYQAEGRAEDSRSLVNYRIGQIQITGEDVKRFIPANTEVKITLSIDVSQNMMLAIEFPTLHFEIEKTLTFDPTVSVKVEQVEELLAEIELSLRRLEESDQYAAQLSDFFNQNERIEEILKTEGPLEQAHNLAKELLMNLDLEEKNLEWPELVLEINEAFRNLEQLVNKCVSEGLTDHEKDQRAFEFIKDSKTAVLDSKRLDRGKELLENIRTLEFQITDRHAGKERRIAWIRSWHRNFATIHWKNESQARVAVDQGMQLVNTGASFDQLNHQVSEIIHLLADRNDFNGVGGGQVQG